MRLFSLLLRVLILVAGAVIGLGLFLFAVIAFVGFLLVSLLRGRRPNLQFRVNKNPWAQHRPPAADVVDVEAREISEVNDAASLPPPQQR
ncbi:hypothetical protein [Roseateles saccharophilus]|uniref:Uncharacterized protein n=1 Tax=Roseateles saccharophilus TaxID=304 RepID=A0A4R3VEV4_ROSSA|nr:hypothetical protein [Roseateles saccharophilus]MDG0833915.1 hypothetical protein [Roseateles saccharophilus]TCV02262.1 hypothetical protein EV671_100435 [Roseateles saccharophilus]